MITFITGNLNKVREVEAILNKPMNHLKLDLVEIQSVDPIEIVLHKLKQAQTCTDSAVMVEDVSLVFTSLKSLPGPFIKFFLDMGLEALVKLLKGFDDHSAVALCTIAYAQGPNAEPQVFQGVLKGTIVDPRGSRAFGWDPIFQPLDCPEFTFAEMPPELKNKMSHRFKALEKLKAFLDGTSSQ